LVWLGVAIAGWLMIGLALLLLVAVINNSWRPLLDQFRNLGKTEGGATRFSERLADIKDRPPAPRGPVTLPSLTPAPLEIPPADVVEPGEPPTATA
jgi:hypothetical protein